MGDAELEGGSAHGLKRLHRRLGCVLRIVKDAVQCFSAARASEAAAGIAYYTLFSLFPVLLVFVSIGGYILQDEEARQRLLVFMTGAFPVSPEVIERNLEQVLQLRGPVGALALVSLLWSAMGAFSVLVVHVNRAWSNAAPRSFLHNRLIALGMIAVLGLLLVLSLTFATVLELLSRLDLPATSLLFLERIGWRLVRDVLPWPTVFLVLLLLYRWVPSTKVRWVEALWGSVVATGGWKIVTDGLTWFIGTGVLRYELVYGSLSAIVVLLTWIYLGGTLVLFGAHLSAAVARQGRRMAATVTALTGDGFGE